jgi:hypothetical protein
MDGFAIHYALMLSVSLLTLVRLQGYPCVLKRIGIFLTFLFCQNFALTLKYS